jgi:hypothetical protein
MTEEDRKEFRKIVREEIDRMLIKVLLGLIGLLLPWAILALAKM